jgi:Ca2+-transporting ATPase
MAVPVAKVLRAGTEIEIPADEVVPGDIISLRTGDRVPADGRLLEISNLKVDEASLTGESVPVEKQTTALSNLQSVVADRNNMVYSGTDVTYGRGQALVVASGIETEFGKISEMLQHVESERTPLQQNLDRVGRILGVTAGAIVVLIVALGLLRGEPLLEMFIFGIALAVAVVPEALPAVVTISLAIGMQRMIKRNALVNRLPTVETLGSTSVICSDKTGTLTRDEMMVRSVWHDGKTVSVNGAGYEPVGEFLVQGEPVELSPGIMQLLRCGVLASDTYLVHNDEWCIKGDPTEGALIVAAAKAGIAKTELDKECPRIGEIPFTSESKRMVTMHQDGETTLLCAKGAPEVVLDMCSRILTEQGEVELTPDQRQAALGAASKMARGALRVIGLGIKTGADLESVSKDSEDMVFLGLAGMIDPPRPEAAQAIESCRRAGITPIMITGDHPDTAAAIAIELGITQSRDVVTGIDLDGLSDAALADRVAGINVYARVSPEHKLRVVNAWKSNGHIVAMTGDGVNDAPALKRADIGIAMGITGTDVSKEAADMTLMDDNFSSIVSAVEEGRAIFSNIKKYLVYLLSSNIGEIGLLTFAALAGLPLPLTAVQILYVNLATDGLPALALAVDPQEDDLMKLPPRNSRRGVFTAPVIALMLAGGLWSTIANFGLFNWALYSGRDLEQAMTMTFASLVLIEFLKAYSFRSDHHSVIHNPFANKWLNLAVLWEVVLLGVIIYLPILQVPFSTYALNSADWFAIAVTACTIVPVLESVKYLIRKGVFDAAGEAYEQRKSVSL